MHIKHIEGYTRVIGEQQGYIGLPLREITLNDPVTGPGTPAMESAWKLDPADIEAVRYGADIVLRVVGDQHPPVMLYVQHQDPPANMDEYHNRAAGEIVHSIVKPVLVAGGSMSDVMVLTESVLLGVCLACVKLGGDEKALDIMVENVRGRLAEIRLKDVKTAGNA